MLAAPAASATSAMSCSTVTIAESGQLSADAGCEQTGGLAAEGDGSVVEVSGGSG